MAADTALAVAWPTAPEYKEAYRKLADADEEIDSLRRDLGRLCKPEVAPSIRSGAPSPEPADIAHLSIFIAHADLVVDTIRRDLAEIKQIRDAVLLDLGLDGAHDRSDLVGGDDA